MFEWVGGLTSGRIHVLVWDAASIWSGQLYTALGCAILNAYQLGSGIQHTAYISTQ